MGDAQNTDPSTNQTGTKPNIVILFADDAGYADFGFQPSVRQNMKKLTPHIDTIAAAGARFTNGYMSGCVCSPFSRRINDGTGTRPDSDTTTTFLPAI